MIGIGHVRTHLSITVPLHKIPTVRIIFQSVGAPVGLLRERRGKIDSKHECKGPA